MSFVNTPRIRILRGISGSGKSTYANELKPLGWYVVSRDKIRLELLGQDGLQKYFENGMDPFLEEYITKIEERELAGHIVKGHKVVIDNTHIKREYVQKLVNMFYDLGVDPDEVVLVEFECDLETAKERVTKRDKKPISDQVLTKQYRRFYDDRFSLKSFKLNEEEGLHGWVPKPFNKRGKIVDGKYVARRWFLPEFDTLKYTPDTDKPKAVICDLDGTSAKRTILTEPYPHMRSYYSYKGVYNDEPDELVKAVIQGFMAINVEVIFVSGRKAKDVEDGVEIDVYKDTKRFIEDKLGYQYPYLYMRNPEMDVDANGNDLHDDVVKHRLFWDHIAKDWNVIGALDDRARVCAVWEDIGIKCLNCSAINDIGTF